MNCMWGVNRRWGTCGQDQRIGWKRWCDRLPTHTLTRHSTRAFSSAHLASTCPGLSPFIVRGCSYLSAVHVECYSLSFSLTLALSLSYTGYFCRRLFTPTRALHTCTSLDTHSPDVWARAACHADAWPPGASSGCLARSKPMVCPSPRSASSIGPVDTAGGAKGAARHRDTAGVEKELALGMVSAGRLSGGKGRLGGRQKGGRRGGVSASHWAWGVPPGEGGRGGAGCNTCSHRRKRRRMGLH